MSAILIPKRGEVWRVCFDPSVGAEIKKERPAVVISENSLGKLPLKIIVPITEWSLAYSSYPWFVHIPKSAMNGLTKESGADAFQVKSVSLHRFVSCIGTLLDSELDDISNAIAICIGAS